MPTIYLLTTVTARQHMMSTSPTADASVSQSQPRFAQRMRITMDISSASMAGRAERLRKSIDRRKPMILAEYFSIGCCLCLGIWVVIVQQGSLDPFASLRRLRLSTQNVL